MRKLQIVIVGVLLGTLVAWISIPRIETAILMWVPPTWWIEVTDLHVEDTRAGEVPRMSARRVIHQPIAANWNKSVRREGPRGFVTVCERDGRSDFLPEAVLPLDMDLDWWTGDPYCPPLEPGRYVLSTVWMLQIPGILPKEYRVTSNIFEVTP